VAHTLAHMLTRKKTYILKLTRVNLNINKTAINKKYFFFYTNTAWLLSNLILKVKYVYHFHGHGNIKI
jgi:hypothetical protein